MKMVQIWKHLDFTSMKSPILSRVNSSHVGNWSQGFPEKMATRSCESCGFQWSFVDFGLHVSGLYKGFNGLCTDFLVLGGFTVVTYCFSVKVYCFWDWFHCGPVCGFNWGFMVALRAFRGSLWFQTTTKKTTTNNGNDNSNSSNYNNYKINTYNQIHLNTTTTTSTTTTNPPTTTTTAAAKYYYSYYCYCYCYHHEQKETKNSYKML